MFITQRMMVVTKLLTELLDVKIINYKMTKVTDYGDSIDISYIDKESWDEFIFSTTLTDLANMCKVHFLNYGSGYCIMSFIDFDGTWFANISGSVFKKSFQGQSEHEAVFKASQWIMDLEDENIKIKKDAELEEQHG